MTNQRFWMEENEGHFGITNLINEHPKMKNARYFHGREAAVKRNRNASTGHDFDVSEWPALSKAR